MAEIMLKGADIRLRGADIRLQGADIRLGQDIPADAYADPAVQSFIQNMQTAIENLELSLQSMDTQIAYSQISAGAKYKKTANFVVTQNPSIKTLPEYRDFNTAYNNTLTQANNHLQRLIEPTVAPIPKIDRTQAKIVIEAMLARGEAPQEIIKTFSAYGPEDEVQVKSILAELGEAPPAAAGGAGMLLALGLGLMAVMGMG